MTDPEISARSRARRALVSNLRAGGVALGLITGIAAVLRVVWTVTQAEQPGELRDPGLYLLLSEQLANGNGYNYGPLPEQGVTAYYPPGLPFALAPFQALAKLWPGEVSPWGVAIAFNVVLSIATVPLIFALGRRLVNTQVGLGAAAVFALWPNLIVHSGLVLTETLFLFLFVLTMLVAMPTPELARAPGWRRVAVVGLLFGAIVMVRPTSIVVAPLFVLLWWRKRASAAVGSAKGDTAFADAVKRVALVGAATLAVILPWTIRNAISMDSFVLISTNMGDNLCIGNRPDATGGYELPAPPCNESTAGIVRPRAEIVRQNDNLHIAREYITNDTGEFLRKIPTKLGYTLDQDSDGLFGATDFGARPLWPPADPFTEDGELAKSEAYENAKTISNTYYYAVGVVGLLGIVLLLRRDSARRNLFLVLAAVIQLIPPALSFGEPRFKMPIYPALAIAAAAAVVLVVTRLRGGTEAAATRTNEEEDSGAGEDGRVAAGSSLG